MNATKTDSGFDDEANPPDVAAFDAARAGKPTGYAKALHAERVRAQEAEQGKATARPWKFGGVDSREIFQIETGRSICKVEFRMGRLDDTARANAALIVQAVNEHAALCAVAEAAEPALAHGSRSDRDALRAALDVLTAVRAGKVGAK